MESIQKTTLSTGKSTIACFAMPSQSMLFSLCFDHAGTDDISAVYHIVIRACKIATTETLSVQHISPALKRMACSLNPSPAVKNCQPGSYNLDTIKELI